MPRFFVDSPLRSGESLALPDTVVRHVQVLRLQPGAGLVLFNGAGPAYAASLADIGKRHAVALLGEALPANGTAPPYRIELAQGVASNEKMDWLIEKAVELGVERIVPLLAERSVVRLSGDRAARRHAHWQALVRAACEQCARDAVPDVVAPEEVSRWLAAVPRADAPPGLRLLLSPRATRRFADLPATPPAGRVSLLIGPEGGWSDTEETQARDAGYVAISLGPRILRTETAGIALLAALAGRWGGW